MLDDEYTPESDKWFSQRLSSPSSDAASRSSALLTYRLIYALENERHAPEILPYPAEAISGAISKIVECTAIARQAEENERRDAEDSADGVSLLPFRPSDIIKLELQRIRFFLTDLLRTRLRKIKSLCTRITSEPTLSQPRPPEAVLYRPLLSDNERIVADRLTEIFETSVQRSGLQFAPAALQKLTPNLPHGEGEEILPEPNLNTRVFVLALEDLGDVELAPDVVQHVSPGEIFLVPYRTFRSFIVDGRARLV